MSDEFRPVPPGAKRYGPPIYGWEGENKNERKAPGGNLGEERPPGGDGGPGPVIGQPVEPVEDDPTEPDYRADKWDYIHYAASRANQYPSEIRSRIQTAANIDAHTSETGYTALHIAVKFDQSEAVRQLIAARARIDTQDVLGQTPLSLACCYDISPDIPRLLLDAEASIEHEDKYSWRPLFWAASKGYFDVVKLLVDRGARKNVKDKRGQRPYDVTSQQQQRIRDLLA